MISPVHGGILANCELNQARFTGWNNGGCAGGRGSWDGRRRIGGRDSECVGHRWRFCWRGYLGWRDGVCGKLRGGEASRTSFIDGFTGGINQQETSKY